MSIRQYNYVAIGVLKDPQNMSRLLARPVQSMPYVIDGYTVGKVRGSIVNSGLRSDIVDNDWQTRVLVPASDSSTSVDTTLYPGLSEAEMSLIGMFAYEGVVNGLATDMAGVEGNAELHLHVKRPHLSYEVLARDEQDEYLNGYETTMASIDETRRRFLERMHSGSPERR